MHVRNLIIGGGVTGLSAAYHLEKLGATDYLLVEKEPVLGGLCASVVQQGFTFDYSGHLLHLRDPYALKLVKTLLGGNLQKMPRKAWIYTGSSRVPFPFQANLHALPEETRQECLAGAQAAAAKKPRAPKTFEQWCLQAFGAGIYRHFLKPYNQKIWQTDPAELTADWCGEFVPRPDLAQIQRGARGPLRSQLGYNATFYYPRRGGCGALTDALAAHVPNVWLNAALQRVDLKTRVAVINGKRVTYDNLVNTLPLPVFLQLTGEPKLAQLAQKLANTTVRVFNFAVKRAVAPFSWIYLPDEADGPAYRVGMQSGFAQANAPQNTSSFYVETAAPGASSPAEEKRILGLLAQKGIIDRKDKILLSFWQTIPVAYALYNPARRKTVDQALSLLQRQRCFCAGRYGLWEYSFIERCLLQGRETAEKLV